MSGIEVDEDRRADHGLLREKEKINGEERLHLPERGKREHRRIVYLELHQKATQYPTRKCFLDPGIQIRRDTCVWYTVCVQARTCSGFKARKAVSEDTADRILTD